MSKILIIGNGFDLFHHLPTKYQHFIAIMQTIEKYEFSEYLDFNNLFSKHFKDKFPVDYNLICNNYNVVNFNFSLEKIKLINEFLESNLWYKYFKNVCEIETWIDFEIEIENVLNELKIFDKYDDKRVLIKNAFQDYLIDYTDFDLFELISFINSKAAFKINEKYINKKKGLIDIKKMVEDLGKSFEDFIKIFNRYLVDIVSVFYAEQKQKSPIPFHLIKEIYTFNYTPTIEKIYKIDKSKIIYLHGEINEDCQKQNLVLGVCEISDDIKLQKAFDFTKYHQKITKRANTKFIEVPKSLKSSSGETVFYIFGHSLDQSDKEYIVDLFKFLEFDLDKQSKICVFCYDKKDEINKVKNLLSIISKDVLVELNRCGRLDFIEMTTENIIKEFSKELSIGSLYDFIVI